MFGSNACTTGRYEISLSNYGTMCGDFDFKVERGCLVNSVSVEHLTSLRG